MAKRIEVKREGRLVKAWIDDSELSFGADGLAAGNVEAGAHSLMWVVLGAPGDTYTIAITKPKGLGFTQTGKLDASKRDAGIHWFEV